MANKKPKYKKITSELKELLRVAYVQGEVDPQGFRRGAFSNEAGAGSSSIPTEAATKGIAETFKPKHLVQSFLNLLEWVEIIY